MHVVTKKGTVVGIGVEIELAPGRAELVLRCFHDLMAVVNEWIVARPHAPDDLHAGIVAMRMDGNQPAAWSQRFGQRRDHALGLELERGARAIGLRRDHEIVVGDRPTRARDDRVE